MRRGLLRGVLLLAFWPLWGLGAAPVATVRVEYREVPRVVAADGVVEAVRRATLATQVTGQILEMPFDLGERVRKGQVLVRTDAKEAAYGAAAAQAQVAQADAQLQQFRADYQRARQLYERRFISQAALDKAEADYREAEGRTQALQAAASQARTAAGRGVLLAPFDGVVAAREAEPGDLAQPGRPLMTLFDPARLRVVAAVPHTAAAAVRRASRAEVELPALGARLQALRVEVSPAADSATLTIQARLPLPPQPGLFPGMFAKIRFVVGRERRLVIPESAVLRRGELVAAYVVAGDGRPRLRQLRLGEPAAEGWVEVLAGLGEGESIAANPLQAGLQRLP